MVIYLHASDPSLSCRESVIVLRISAQSATILGPPSALTLLLISASDAISFIPGRRNDGIAFADWTNDVGTRCGHRSSRGDVDEARKLSCCLSTPSAPSESTSILIWEE